MSTQTGTTTCYRHPGRETRVACSSCGRPICPDCMRPSPVGMRCPECAAHRTPVTRMRDVTAPATPAVTVGLIAANVLVFLGEGNLGLGGASGPLLRDFALFGPAVADGEWYRLITGGFLHANLVHLAFNMLLLWLLGRELEGELGRARFLGIYVASLLAGSFGALLFNPLALTVGASGAVFGLMGAAAAMLYARGVNPLQTGIGSLILLNLFISFVIPNISIGGHLGGLIGGAVCGYVVAIGERRGSSGAAGWAAIVLVAVPSAVGAVLVAGGAGLGLDA